MNLLRIFGIGKQRILSENCSVTAVVTRVTQTALHTVKKPVRLYTSPDNTLYSHFITFRYYVDGAQYTGILYVDLRYRCPAVGEEIEVFFDPSKPNNYACYAFGFKSGGIGW